jgi:uncharacterized protein (TIGR02246 family)
MRKWKQFGILSGLVVAVTFCWLSGAGMTPAQNNEPNAKGKEPPAPGKGKRAQEFIEAFDKGDAKAVAAFWTVNGDFIDHAGHKYQGRTALEKLYAKTFAENKGAKLTITVTSARLVGPEVAIEEGITEVVPAEGGPPSVAAFSAVLFKQNDVWYFESVRESVAHPPSNAAHFEDIEWLLGDWTGEPAKGESFQVSYEWAENHNFIVSSFDNTLNGIPVIGGTQWIGWDAVGKQIRSWSFYSGGGFGDAVWSQNGGAWSVKTSAQTADGKKISGTNVITPADKDHFTWQMTKLTVDGQQQPDPAPVKMARAKPEQK